MKATELAVQTIGHPEFAGAGFRVECRNID